MEIRQNNEMLAWSGKFESGQSVASAFRVFRGSVLSWVSAEGLMDVLKGKSIPVDGRIEGRIDTSRAFGCRPVTTQELLWE